MRKPKLSLGLPAVGSLDCGAGACGESCHHPCYNKAHWLRVCARQHAIVWAAVVYTRSASILVHIERCTHMLLLPAGRQGQ